VTVRVVIADDQHLVRAGLRALLDRAADITVVGEAADGQEAIALVRAEQPDAVLMDVRMPRSSAGPSAWWPPGRPCSRRR
jgi:YesN/AraC family two-component response regulator